MERIQIVFEIRIDGRKFPRITFADTTPIYKNITLVPKETDDFRYEILVDKNLFTPGNNEIRTIIHEATVEAQSFIYVFSFVANVKIFEFACKGYMRGGSLINTQQVFGTGGIELTGHLSVGLGQENVKQLKESMKQDYDLSKLQVFFDAATIEEPVSRFISLYTLMLHCCGDSQPKVDKAIVGIDPTVFQNKSPKGGYETVFTKLRNELSHKRDGINMIETHNQVRANIQRFEYIVKKHMLCTA